MLGRSQWQAVDERRPSPYSRLDYDSKEFIMSTRFEVPAEKLAWRCDLSFLPYSCTAEMTPLEDFIGQERAIRAIEFGLGVNKPGFNIFVTGLTGTGKTSIIKAFLKKITAGKCASVADSPVPEDWCYVYNFTDADRPLALKNPSRLGESAQDGHGTIRPKSSARSQKDVRKR